MDLLKARDTAFQLANSKFQSDYGDYSKYSPIYLAATSNVKDMLSLYHNYTNVLTVGSTGAIGFEAAINGAKKVDMFDINELQQVYYELFKTAITHLEYNDFIKHFSLKNQKSCFRKSEIKDLISNEMYENLKPFLSSDVKFVLDPLYEYFYSADLVLSGLYRFEYLIDITYLNRFISFYNEKDYTRLQNILKNNECEFNYYNVNLTDVPAYFKDQYDLVLLDNIFQYYQSIPSLDTPFKVNQFVQEQLINNVKEHGSIQVGYGFELATASFAEKFQLPYDNPKTNSSLARLRIIQEIQEGINVALYKNWNGYQYDFIPGVEAPYETAKNLVLTFKKK